MPDFHPNAQIDSMSPDARQELKIFKRNGGWTWFQDERVVVHNGCLLIGSAAAITRDGSEAGDIDITSYNLMSGVTRVFKLKPRYQRDDHNAPAILVLADGRLIVGYQSHPLKDLEGQDLMRWRVSTSPHDGTSWSEEHTISAGGSVSYCHLFSVSEERGRIYSFFRGPNTKPHYLVSDDGGSTFRHVGQLLSWTLNKSDPRYSGMDGFRPYLKYASDGYNSIHLIASEDHPRAWPNSIYHGLMTRGRICHSDGRDIGPVGTGANAPVHIDHLTPIFKGDENNIAWPMDLHVDVYGFPIALFSVRKNDSAVRRNRKGGGDDHRYMYARWDGSRWNVSEMCFGGTAIYPGEEDFTGLAAIDPDRPGVVFVSTNGDPVTGKPLISAADGKRHWEIFRGITRDGGNSWNWFPVTTNSIVDNIRPTIPHWTGGWRAVLWMLGNYQNFTEFSTDIVGIIEER